jgi:hypothetical protein
MDNLMSETARLSDPDVKLLLESTERGPDSRDRMRTMFTKKFSPYRTTVYQIPDSAYVLGLARDKLVGVRWVFDAYEKAKRVFATNRALLGWYFELVFHAVVRWDHGRPQAERAMNVVQGLVSGTGPTWKDNLGSLTAPNKYWTPSLFNFPDIDSALIHEGTLYAFQCTMKQDHSFDYYRFRETFEQVKSKISPPLRNRAVVYFVHPYSVDFTGRVGEVLVPPPMTTRSALSLSSSGLEGDPSESFTLTIMFRKHPVRVDEEEAFKNSVMDLFRGLSGPDRSSSQ